MEATSGFEPLNRGFADLPLNHLGTSPRRCRSGVPAWLPLEDFEPRLTDPKSAVLPLDEGAPAGLGSLSLAGGRPGPDRSLRTRKWSGRRDSNPRPSPWQGDALPTEPLPLGMSTTGSGGAESQDRTGDTAIFSRVLYQLSYLGPMANQARLPVGGPQDSTHVRLATRRPRPEKSTRGAGEAGPRAPVTAPDRSSASTRRARRHRRQSVSGFLAARQHPECWLKAMEPLSHLFEHPWC